MKTSEGGTGQRHQNEEAVVGPQQGVIKVVSDRPRMRVVVKCPVASRGAPRGSGNYGGTNSVQGFQDFT